MIAAELAVDTVLVAVALAAVFVALVDAARIWRARPPVVRDAAGRWRAAPRLRNGWGRR
jgi:hypothetical protein